MFIKTSLSLHLLHEGITQWQCVLQAQCPPSHWLQEWPLPSLVTYNWSWPGLRAPGLASHVQGSAQQHKTGPNTNSSMVRNLSEKLITKCNVLIHIIHFVYRSAPHCTGQPLLHVSVVLRNALSPLTRCGPYDTRYHSRQTHTKWHNINFHREPAIARLNSSRMSQYMSMSTN